MAEDKSGRPHIDPPANRKLGAAKGSWWIAMLTIVLVVAAVFVVLLLVDQGKLDRGWAYFVLPFAIIAAAASRVLTIFKAGAEDKET